MDFSHCVAGCQILTAIHQGSEHAQEPSGRPLSSRSVVPLGSLGAGWAAGLGWDWLVAFMMPHPIRGGFRLWECQCHCVTLEK